MRKYLFWETCWGWTFIALACLIFLPHISLADTNYPSFFRIQSSSGSGGTILNTPVSVSDVSSTSFIYQSSTASGGRGAYTIYLNSASSSPITYMPDYTGSAINSTNNLLSFFQGTGCCSTGGGASGTSYWAGGLVSGTYTIIYSTSQSNSGAGDCIQQGLTSLSNCLGGSFVSWAQITIVPTPSISFVFPENGTTTPDFSSWRFVVENLNASDTYNLQVNYYQTGNTSQSYADLSNFPGSVTSGLVIVPKSQSLVSPFNATTSWTANVTLYDQNDLSFFESDTSQFTIESNGTVINNNGSSSFVTANPINYLGTGALPSVNETCAAPTSSVFSDPASYTAQALAYGLCNVSVFLFVPSTNIQVYMSSSISNIQSVMPFSLGYGILNSVENAVTSSSIPAEQDLTWQMNAGSAGTVPITMISSSTLVTAFGSSNKSLIFLWEDYIFWTMTVLYMFFAVYSFIHKIAGHESDSQRAHRLGSAEQDRLYKIK